MKKILSLVIILSSSALIQPAMTEDKTLKDFFNNKENSKKIESMVPEKLKFKKMQKFGEKNKTLMDIFRPKK
jgi:hypothetical protein